MKALRTFHGSATPIFLGLASGRHGPKTPASTIYKPYLCSEFIRGAARAGRETAQYPDRRTQTPCEEQFRVHRVDHRADLPVASFSGGSPRVQQFADRGTVKAHDDLNRQHWVSADLGGIIKASVKLLFERALGGIGIAGSKVKSGI